MKKLISLFLCVVMLATALSSCAITDVANISANISVASSAAESYAEWLTDRLDFVPDNVIMAVGDDNAYGIDMSDFEDDGYIIKNVGGDVLLLGKTEEGLDLAARKYANSVDLDRGIEDTVYHEGYRVEKFTLFGRDIDQYTIVYPEEHNENMRLAVSEFQKLIKQACGVELPLVIGETDASPLIRFEYSDKEEFKVGGYEYFEENGDLVFSGAPREGSTNAVYRFLENECNWDWLIYGNSDLQETDHLVIETGLYKTETPAFEWHLISANYSRLRFKTDRTVDNSQNLTISDKDASYPMKHACHGLYSYGWAGMKPDVHSGQFCYTAETYYYTALDNILAYLKDRKKSGAVIGETIRAIDISQGDSGRYCECGNCFTVVAEEKAIIGPVVKWANSIAEEINAEFPDADLMFQIFAYYNAFQPPKVTYPNEWVSVSYAPNGACANHPMDSVSCDPDTETEFGVTGIEFAEYLDGWCAISDNIYLWYYHISENFNYYNAWDVIYYDYTHMHEIGVQGVYQYGYDRGMGLKSVEHLLSWYLNWDIDMTFEEYEELFHEILEVQYGEGWEYLLEVLDMYEEMDTGNCWNCWGYFNMTAGAERYDLGYLAENFDVMKEYLEKAILLAGSADEETRCEMFSISLYYCNCYANFFKAYNDNDAELLASLETDYQLVIDRLAENGYSHKALPSYGAPSMSDTIYDEAFLVWVENRALLPAGENPERPIPEEYIPVVTTVTEAVPAE